MRRIGHYVISDQVSEINAALGGHYAYYGIAGNLRSLLKVYRVTERYCCRMLRAAAGMAAALPGTLSTSQRTEPDTATEAAAPVPGAASTRGTVNQMPKSVVGKSARSVLWEPEAGDRLR